MWHTARVDPRFVARAGFAFGLCLCLGAVAECQDPAHAEIERGAYVYSRLCALCHGAQGEGYAADASPALANQEFLATASDAFLYEAVEHGRSATTMSPWARSRGGPLLPYDLGAVVAYMRSWQTVPTATLDERPIAGDPIRGAALFDARCASCHGTGGLVGAKYLRLAGPELLTTATTGFLRHALRVGRPGTPMPGYAETIGEQGVEDVLAALRGWQTHPTADPGKPPPPTLGPVVVNPKGADPVDFTAYPGFTPADIVKAALDKGARLGFVDARPPPSYVERHIAFAVNVPFYDTDPWTGQLPKDAWLVCYCGCPHAESGSLAGRLLQAGFTKVTVLDEGYYAGWEYRGWPTHTGSTP